jgi:TRAP-type C4-dicarboxylate transport system permease small subunit
LLPKKIQKIIEFIDYAIVMVVLAYLFLKGMSLVEQLATSGRLTNILGIPYQVLYGAMPIGCILMIVNYTSVMINELFLKRDNMPIQGEAEVNS